MAVSLGSFLGGFVQGLAGFGFGLVALSFLAFVREPVQAIVAVTMLAFAFTLIDAVRLLRDVEARAVLVFALGTLGGTPLLAILTASTFRRLIGALLVRAALLGLMAVRPLRLVWPGWALLAGMLSGVLGGAVHAARPPVVLYAAGRGRSGRRAKANL